MEPLKPGRMSAPGKTEPTELIVRARTGDTQAWGDLYREYAPAIFRFCRRAMPTREDAEDATMEIFIKLRDKLARSEEHTSELQSHLNLVCRLLLEKKKSEYCSFACPGSRMHVTPIATTRV